jgi:hypothetical protein
MVTAVVGFIAYNLFQSVLWPYITWNRRALLPTGERHAPDHLLSDRIFARHDRTDSPIAKKSPGVAAQKDR